ncbi:MAG: glycosyltransferase [Eubacteriales bacterium]|nr:glycosyltransferase [Eubacteriales bacterium]
MRVLLIDVNCKNSSTGKIVYDLYTGINENGDEAAFCYGRGPLIQEKNIYKFGLDWETYLHALLTRITGFTGCFSFFSTRRLIKFINDFKPDVVHIHELHAYFVNIKPLLSNLKENQIRTIMTLHCEFMYTGKCGHSVECEKWKTECNKCPHLHDYPSAWIFDHTNFMFKQKKKLFRDFNNLTIVTPSQWLADRVKESFLGDKRIEVIHNGIDTKNIFYPRDTEHLKQKHNLTEEKIVLAVAPNLMSEQKGGKWVLELANLLRNENIKFILIGVDDLSRETNDNVILLGRISNQDELAEYYSLADVFVICSEKETFSLTCSEAICCGSQIVGFECGAPETIFENPYARFVEYGDLSALTEMVTNSLKDPLPKKDVAAYGSSKYSIKTMYSKYLELYKS